MTNHIARFRLRGKIEISYLFNFFFSKKGFTETLRNDLIFLLYKRYWTFDMIRKKQKNVTSNSKNKNKHTFTARVHQMIIKQSTVWLTLICTWTQCMNKYILYILLVQVKLKNMIVTDIFESGLPSFENTRFLFVWYTRCKAGCLFFYLW